MSDILDYILYVSCRTKLIKRESCVHMYFCGQREGEKTERDNRRHWERLAFQLIILRIYLSMSCFMSCKLLSSRFLPFWLKSIQHLNILIPLLLVLFMILFYCASPEDHHFCHENVIFFYSCRFPLYFLRVYTCETFWNHHFPSGTKREITKEKIFDPMIFLLLKIEKMRDTRQEKSSGHKVNDQTKEEKEKERRRKRKRKRRRKRK